MTRPFPPRSESPEARRAFLLHYAGVLTNEARARSGSTFAASLTEWADRARREADALSPAPIQLDMFSACEGRP